MTDSYQAYGLLFSQIWGNVDLPMVARDTGANSKGILLAADRKGQRHLMAPLTEGQLFQPQTWDSLRLVETSFNGARYMDLVCTSDSLATVFASFADQVVRRVSQEEQPPAQALQRILGEWRRLLKPAPALAEDAARGLFGELVALRMLGEHNPAFAIDSWTGPDRELHDFITPRGDLEVKTSGSEGLGIVVSALHQLDPPGDRPLVLLRIHVESSPRGRNIGDMVREICALGIFQDEVVEKLAAAGFLYGADPDEYRFAVVGEPLAWLVDEDFPGLRASDVPEHRRNAIGRVSYSLDLNAAGEHMNSSELAACLEGLMTK